MKIIQNIKLKHQQKFLRLLCKSFLFLLIYILLYILFRANANFYNDNIFLSGIDITKSWVIGFVLNLLLWLVYLVFFTKDDSFVKIWNVLKLRGTFGYPKEISLRWSVLILQIVFSLIFFKPNFLANINAISSKLIYNGNISIYEDFKNDLSYDKRFKKVYIKIGEEKIILEGKTFEINKIIDKKNYLKVYDGVFFKYVLVNTNHK